MEESPECAICMEALPNVYVCPCQHELCLRCALTIKLCPFCRGDIKRLDYCVKYKTAAETRRNLAAMYPPGDLYKAIKPLIRGNDAEKIAALITSVVDLVGGWLTVAQANKLLARAEETNVREYFLCKLVVQLCHLPWDVDLKLGGCGLCYYGNYGDAPSLQDAINMLRVREKKRIGKIF